MTRTGMAPAGITRRRLALAPALALTEAALAQRASIQGVALPADMVWLNANENPEGPPKAALQAMIEVLPTSGRYHYQEYQDFYARVARFEGLEPDQILIGSGSSEVLQAAVHAFTGPGRPLICPNPTYESPLAVTEALSRKVVRVPLREDNTSDVKALAQAADREGGGLIYLCNPNNPTSTINTADEIHWLVTNLPKNTVAMIDEAYIHFSESPDVASAFRYVKEGRNNVVVTRSYSKIYGMAGLRAGFAAGVGELMRKMEPFRNNVISIVAVRAVLAAIADPSFIADRKARYNKVRGELCAWFREKGLRYIDPHANFVMVEVNKDVRTMQQRLAAKGVGVGRPFPPLDRMMRVSVGTAADMDKFRAAFWEVLSA
jgi:histidinol-phosphate aminotransferase